MIDREINLEDSCGLLWRVTVCKHNGSLAIKQGWPEFSSGHDVKVGEFIVVQYVPSDEHFICQIFGTSSCERRTLPKPISLVVELHKVKYNLTEHNQGMLSVHNTSLFKCLCCVVLNILCLQHFLTVIFCCCYVMKMLSEVSLLIHETDHPLTQSTILIC